MNKNSLPFLMKNEIETLMNKKWKHISTISSIEEDYPGNYLLAWSSENLDGKKITVGEVFYVGMSNAKAGVKSRLKQFMNAAYGRSGHSGGIRFFKVFCKQKPYSLTKHKKLFFVEHLMKCNVSKQQRSPEDLLVMGKVCLLEMELLAYVKAHTGKEPDLNKK